VRQAWPIFEPAEPMRDTWHIGAVCEHLEALARGQIQNLIITIPPGHAKSLLVSVAFPAWVWTWKPHWRAIFSSYAHTLAVRDSVRCRNVIESPWYVSHFMRPLDAQGTPNPNGWTMAPDANRQADFGNTRSGRRLSTSVDGTNTGERGNCIVGDDVLSVKDSTSEQVRKTTNDWWEKTMSSRLNVPARDQRVLMGQRIHEDDPQGRALASGLYEHLSLPSHYDPKRACVTHVRKVQADGTADEDAAGNEQRSVFFRDPRKEPGELLFPALFPGKVLDHFKKVLGSQYNAQYEQDPTSEEGATFKRAYWRFWKPDGTAAEWKAPRPDKCWEGPAVPLPKLWEIVLSLDAAFKDGEKNDYVVFTVWGVWQANRYLLDMVREHADFTRTVAVFRALVKKYGVLMYNKYVEDKANGTAVINMLKNEIAGIIPVEPEGGKESRAAAMQPMVQSGNIYLPDGAPWLEDFISEFAKFPKGKHDDIVDSTSQAMIALSMSPEIGAAIALSTY